MSTVKLTLLYVLILGGRVLGKNTTPSIICISPWLLREKIHPVTIKNTKVISMYFTPHANFVGKKAYNVHKYTKSLK